MTTRLDSVCRVLGYGLDDNVSWFCVNSIGVRTGLPHFLVVYIRYWNTDYTTTSHGSVCTELEQGLDDHVSW